MRLMYGVLVTGWLAASNLAEKVVVQVFVPPAGPPVSAALFHAQTVAARIFSDVGITVKWRTRSTADGCAKRPWRIAIDFSWDTPADVRPTSFAQARPFDTGSVCITVFIDRVQSKFEANPHLMASLLGHILAHEIAHILRGTDSHSEIGVMKPSWTVSEIRGMPRKPLRFTETDALHLLDSVRTRTESPGGSQVRGTEVQ